MKSKFLFPKYSLVMMMLTSWLVLFASEPEKNYLPMLENHFQALCNLGTDTYGPVQTPMWMAILDIQKKKHPVTDHTPGRVYRLIGAPRGSSLYWDQPLVVAAWQLSEITQNPFYRDGAKAYLRAFMDHCIDSNGMFMWGNHMYYDAFSDSIVRFSGGYHELRPITPAWDLFWQNDSLACETYIRTMVQNHLFDPESGGFNRHDDSTKGHAFIEAGGILVESLAWLSRKTGDKSLLETARRIADYSFKHRDPETGLMQNEPDKGRWDAKVLTTEVGVWAQSLLRASEYAVAPDLERRAKEAVTAYLRYGFDETKQKYYGQLDIKTGQPVRAEQPGYWPRFYTDIWNPDQWPTHDYPMPLAEACLTLWEKSGDKIFLEAIYRWAHVIEQETPARNGQGAYADQYGRCIHFLTRAGHSLNDPSLISLAYDLADEAITHLYEYEMFKGHPDTPFYHSVDGTGYLVLSLIYLEGGKAGEMQGFGF